MVRRLDGGGKKWQYLGEERSFGILSRAGQTIPSSSPWGSIRRVWRRKSVGQEIKYYPRGARASFGCGNLGVSSVWRPPKERSRRGLQYVLGVVPRVSRTNNILTRTRQTRNLCSLGAQCLISAPLNAPPRERERSIDSTPSPSTLAQRREILSIKCSAPNAPSSVHLRSPPSPLFRADSSNSPRRPVNVIDRLLAATLFVATQLSRRKLITGQPVIYSTQQTRPPRHQINYALN